MKSLQGQFFIGLKLFIFNIQRITDPVLFVVIVIIKSEVI